MGEKGAEGGEGALARRVGLERMAQQTREATIALVLGSSKLAKASESDRVMAILAKCSEQVQLQFLASLPEGTESGSGTSQVTVKLLREFLNKSFAAVTYRISDIAEKLVAQNEVRIDPSADAKDQGSAFLKARDLLNQFSAEARAATLETVVTMLLRRDLSALTTQVGKYAFAESAACTSLAELEEVCAEARARFSGGGAVSEFRVRAIEVEVELDAEEHQQWECSGSDDGSCWYCGSQEHQCSGS